MDPPTVSNAGIPSSHILHNISYPSQGSVGCDQHTRRPHRASSLSHIPSARNGRFEERHEQKPMMMEERADVGCDQHTRRANRVNPSKASQSETITGSSRIPTPWSARKRDEGGSWVRPGAVISQSKLETESIAIEEKKGRKRCRGTLRNEACDRGRDAQPGTRNFGRKQEAPWTSSSRAPWMQGGYE